MKLGHLTAVFSGIGGLFLAMSCATSSVPATGHITVSIEPLRYVTQAIAGDSYTISTLTPAGASPEGYQPTPQQLVELSESRAYIRVGTLGFERTQLEKITGNMPHLNCVDASAGIDFIPCQHHGPQVSGCEDQHTWTSPANMKVIADNICTALSTMDTLNARNYVQALHRFSHHVDSLDGEIRDILSEAPSRAFLIYHPALAYFAKEYGLLQLSIQHEGKEASAERLAMLIETCRRERVKVVFVQKEFSGRGARVIADEIGAEVVEINPLSFDWEGEMRKIAAAIVGRKR